MRYLVTTKSGIAIQKAIDQAYSNGGGQVVLEPGIYPSGTLHLRSNIELHLQPGAIIQGLPDWQKYEDFCHPELNIVTPENSQKCLIACADSENVFITGHGKIDGQGLQFFDRNIPAGTTFSKPLFPRPRIMQFFHCRNILIEGVSFVDSPNWTCWLVDCEDVRITRIRITGCRQIPNNDGIDIDSCRRVVISDSFFETGDDCLVLRAIRRTAERPYICEQVNVANCLLNSRCQGIRLGCPSDDTIRNCSFSNIIFSGSGSGIHSEHPFRYLRKNCTGYMKISDISFENFDITTDHYPIRLWCEAGIELRKIKRITFRNFRIHSKYPISVEGSGKTVLEDLSFRDIAGETGGDTPLLMRNVRNLIIDEFHLTAVNEESIPFRRINSDSWETKF